MYSKQVTSKDPKTHPTFQAIAKRLKDYHIDLGQHIDKDLKVYQSTLDGVSFVFRKPKNHLIPFDIKSALERATKPGGLPAFRQGKKEHARHWALDASMAATVGVGFREIWDPVLSDRGLRIKEQDRHRRRLGVPGLKAPFSDHFGQRLNRLDVSSLHAAIHGDHCSIHIDETGFVMRGLEGLSDDVTVNPDFLRHLLVELIWKDKLKIPEWFELIVPDSQHSRAGLQLNLKQSEKINVTVTGSCGVSGRFDCSGTLNLFGRHDLGGGGS